MNWLLIIGLLSLSSCHPRSENKRDDARMVTAPIQSPGLPPLFNQAGGEGYHLGDPNCNLSNSGAPFISEARVYKLNVDKVEAQTHNFANTSSINSLASPMISQTVYGHGERAECELIAGEIVCDKNVQATAPAKPLRICNPQNEFKRLSYEAVALTTLSAIERAQTYYQKAKSHDAGLPQSQLIVLPVIEQRIKFEDRSGATRQESIYMTDNMAFMPELAGKPAFIVFPKGPYVAKLGIWQNVNLWESDWVIAHEFGHHVFMHHTQATKTPLQSIRVHDMPTHAPFKSVKKLSSVALAGKNPPFAAVNEGFADLFGFFSVHQNSQALVGLDCFRKSRDPAVAEFANGRTKRLDREVLEIFGGLRGSIQAEDADCDVPDFGEVHSVGAILAHGIYDVLKKSPHYAARNVSDQDFSEILISWANQLGRNYSARVSLVSSFEPLVRPVLELIAAEQQAGKLTSAQCGSIADKFPAIATGLSKDLCK